MKLALNDIILIIIAFEALFVSIFLLSNKKGKRICNRILGFLMLLIGTQMIGILVARLNLQSEYISRLNCVYGLLYGVFIYFYTRSLIYREFQIRTRDFFHLLPAGVVLVFQVFSTQACHPNVVFTYIISLSIYLTLSFYEIRRYHSVLINTQSNFEITKLSWLKATLSVVVIVFLADILQFMLNYLFPTNLQLGELPETLVFILLLGFIVTVVFKGLKHPQIFLGIDTESLIIDKEANAKYRWSKLSDGELSEYLNRLQSYMKHKKPFLEGSLSLKDLAQQLNIPVRHLSQVINEKLGQNYQHYINSHRIEEAKHLLANPRDPKETIQEIMYAVGFNSKSVFHTIFKKQTGLTPSQFKNSIQNNRE